MHLIKSILFASLAACSTAMPSRRQANVLQVQDYAQFQISDGVAGNALQEVAEKFPVRFLPRLDVVLIVGLQTPG
jgi:hypothetical protein